MDDLISRQAAIDALREAESHVFGSFYKGLVKAHKIIADIPSAAQQELIRCKDCKYYSPMDRETKTGICNLTMHQNFGDNWFCAGAERRTDDGSD